MSPSSSVIVSAVVPGTPSLCNTNIRSSVPPGVGLQTPRKQQEGSLSPQVFGLTLSGISEATTLSPRWGVTQPPSPIMLGNGSGTNGKPTASDGRDSKVHGKLSCSKIPLEAPVISWTAQVALGQAPSNGVGFAPLDAVRCAEHHKERTVQNMIRIVGKSGELMWICRPDAPCKVRKGARFAHNAVQHRRPLANELAGVAPNIQEQNVVFATPWTNDAGTNPGRTTEYNLDGGNAFFAAPLTFAQSPAFAALSQASPANLGTVFWLSVPQSPYCAATAADAGMPVPGILPHLATESKFAWLPLRAPN
ncbi:hypothetical protein DQ04_00331190 [Trypanosoma grayi]|uniref:hypothetical protein n=1 Tax=Trypanosoma grayi TaxID=71804 RepID=UPI0004F49FD2|nr:hypothetical protein DQ04_00331190 [Trypanosoma grayi]KEG14726.1 hypothetical protein DQ04_00331190 [Trypanosoma grayi]